jgi:hypothetical protein
MFRIIITRNDISKCKQLVLQHIRVFVDFVPLKPKRFLSLLATAMMISNNNDNFKDLSLTYGILQYLLNNLKEIRRVIRTRTEIIPRVLEEFNRLNIRIDNSRQILLTLEMAIVIIDTRIIKKRVQDIKKKNEKKEKRKRNSCD